MYFLYFSVNFQDIGFKFSGYVDMGILHFLAKFFLPPGLFWKKKLSRKISVLALLYSMDSCRCPQHVFVHENGFWSPSGAKRRKTFFFLKCFSISQSIFKILISNFQGMSTWVFCTSWQKFFADRSFLKKKFSCRRPQYVFVHENGFWSPGGAKRRETFFF